MRNSVSFLGLPQVTYQCHDGKVIQERSVLNKTDLAVIQNTWTLPRASFIGNIREISVDHCYKLKTSLIYTADQSKHILHRHRRYSHLFFRTTRTIPIYVRFSISLVSTPGFISQRMTEGCVLDRYPITVIDTIYTKHVQSMRLGTDPTETRTKRGTWNSLHKIGLAEVYHDNHVNKSKAIFFSPQPFIW